MFMYQNFIYLFICLIFRMHLNLQRKQMGEKLIKDNNR